MNAIPRSVDDRLRALDAKRAAWEPNSNTQNAIDWSRPIALPRWLPRRYVARALSQFLHGERVTAEICRAGLSGWRDQPVIADCLQGQAQDEERHAVLFQGYLRRLGDIAPVDPVLQTVLEAVLAWKGPPEAALVAVNIILEGAALRMLDDLGDLLACPLFTQINRHIARDEARHVAMGKIALRHRLPALDQSERQVIYHWIAALWQECAGGMLADLTVPGVITANRRRRWLDAGWAHQVRAMIDIGLIDDADVSAGLP